MQNNVAVLDESVTLIASISINKNSKIRANMHFYKAIGQKIISRINKSATKSL
jgi:hypothetical protein